MHVRRLPVIEWASRLEASFKGLGLPCGDGCVCLMIMDDQSTHLQQIKDRVLAFARARDWEQFHSPKNLSMAIAAEAAELMEHFLWQSPEQSHADMDTEKVRSEVEQELADILIFAIEFANITGMDIAGIIEAKMKQNAEKYPVEKAKGRSEKYTKL